MAGYYAGHHQIPLERPLPDIASLRPAGGKRSSKRDRILSIFLRQEGHLSADDLFDLVRQRGCRDRPGDRLPHAAVDGRRRHRAQGRFRRRPVALRAGLSPSAPLSSRLQRLPSLVRVPELRRRVAYRGGRRRAQLRRRPRRSLQIFGTCEECRTGEDRCRHSTARRPSSCSRATRCASRSPPSAAASSSTLRAASLTTDARGRTCSSSWPPRSAST